MALIECPECGTAVSTNAKACPQCGNRKLRKPAKFGCLSIVLATVLLCFVICAGITMNQQEGNRGQLRPDGEGASVPMNAAMQQLIKYPTDGFVTEAPGDRGSRLRDTLRDNDASVSVSRIDVDGLTASLTVERGWHSFHHRTRSDAAYGLWNMWADVVGDDDRNGAAIRLLADDGSEVGTVSGSTVRVKAD